MKKFNDFVNESQLPKNTQIKFVNTGQIFDCSLFYEDEKLKIVVDGYFPGNRGRDVYYNYVGELNNSEDEVIFLNGEKTLLDFADISDDDMRNYSNFQTPVILIKK